MSVAIASRRGSIGFSEDPICSCCGKSLKFGDGAISYVTRAYDRLVFCEDCAHGFVRSFIQDYAKLISGENVYHSGIDEYTAEQIKKACDNISVSTGNWLETQKKFKSL